jgi:hypothetical protein
VKKVLRALDRSVFLDADRLALTDCQEETFHKSKKRSIEYFLDSVGFMPNGVELVEAEVRKHSGE